MFVRSGRAPKSECPDCGVQFNGGTGASFDADKTLPSAGIPTVCAYSGALLVFDSQLKARRPTPEMAARLLEQYPLVARLRASILDGSYDRRAGREFDPAKRQV